MPPPASGGDEGARPGLDGEQQRAVGIVVAHPLAAKAPERIEALGLVLDATNLLSELDESSAAAAAERTEAAELARLRALHAGGAGASLKMIDAAEAEQAKARFPEHKSPRRGALHCTGVRWLRWRPLRVKEWSRPRLSGAAYWCAPTCRDGTFSGRRRAKPC